MAMLNEILGPAARFQQLLTRKFGILGGAPSPQLTPEVTPEYSLPTGPENLVLASEMLAAGFLDQAADAGHPSQVALWNPTGSNIIIVVERVEYTNLSASAGCFLLLRKTTTKPFADNPAAGGVQKRETRVQTDAGGASTSLPVGQLCGSSLVAAVGNPALQWLIATQNVLNAYQSPVILAPSWAVVVVTGSNNINIRVCVTWREIPLAPGEQGPF